MILTPREHHVKPSLLPYIGHLIKQSAAQLCSSTEQIPPSPFTTELLLPLLPL